MSLANQSLLKASDSILILIDIQEKFRSSITGFESVIQNGQILLKAANRLTVPVLVSEQYPKGLGSTVSELKQVLPQDQVYFPKVRFSALGSEPLLAALRASGRKQIVIFGVETHVCVLQTSLELLGAGFSVYVVANAVGSRKLMDRDLAINRLTKHGAEMVTTEMVLFEWLGAAGTPEFKDLQQLVL